MTSNVCLIHMKPWSNLIRRRCLENLVMRVSDLKENRQGLKKVTVVVYGI